MIPAIAVVSVQRRVCVRGRITASREGGMPRKKSLFHPGELTIFHLWGSVWKRTSGCEGGQGRVCGRGVQLRQLQCHMVGDRSFRREPTMGYLFIALTVLLTGYAQVILKYEINSVTNMPSGLPMIGFLVKFTLLRPLVLSGFLSGLLASFTWMAALSKFELSYAYPFMSLNFVFVVALSFLLFGEGMHAYKFVGLALICLGVFFVSKAPIEPQRLQASKTPEVVATADSSPGYNDRAAVTDRDIRSLSP